MKNKESNDMEEFWGLSKAQYLTIPRSVIQEMPKEWQDKFATLLNELDNTIDWRPKTSTYWCMLRDNQTGKYKTDPLYEYRHGNSLALDLIKGEI